MRVFLVSVLVAQAVAFQGLPSLAGIRAPQHASASKSLAVRMAAQSVESRVETRKKLAAEYIQCDGFYKPLNLDIYAEDYVFEGPLIGPLCKTDIFNTISGFKMYEAFPDIEVTHTEFTQDPKDPDRFWTVFRVTGTHSVDMDLNTNIPGFKIEATGKQLVTSPQAVSMKFNDENKLVHVSGGYVTHAWEKGATDSGLGAIFGILKSIGAPSIRPGGKTFRLVNYLGWFQKDQPKSKSHVDDLPEAYKSRGRTQGLRASEAWTNDICSQ